MTEPEVLAAGVIGGDRRALSRAITLLESARPEDEAAVDELCALLLPHGGRSLRVGIAGPPGVGKSTLIDALGLLALERGQRVAVLAVDPSSHKTGGSILGDKTRMARLAGDARSYVRPSPSRGERGGLAPRTREAVLACEAAGFDRVLIETVGVGQSDVDVAELCDCLVLLVAAGGGDELQGMKRGLLEHADVLAVTKADGAERERAERAAGELASALALLGGPASVSTLSAHSGEGLAELDAAVEAFVAEARRSGAFEARRRAQRRAWFAQAVEHGLRERLRGQPRLESELAAAVERGELAPRAAARRLLGAFSPVSPVASGSADSADSTGSAGFARPFRVLGLQQVALGALDRSRLHRLWVELLGLSPAATFVSAAENVDEEILRAGPGLLAPEIDLMQPVDPAARPRVQEPALNHLALWIDDLVAAHAWLLARGVRFAGGVRRGAHGHAICFIHPKGDKITPQGGEGVLIELVQAPAQVIEAFEEQGAAFSRLL